VSGATAAGQAPSASTAGRSTEEVARSIGFRAEFVAAVLESERQRGHVERTTDGGWRITTKAERLYGPALRALGFLDGNGRHRA